MTINELKHGYLVEQKNGCLCMVMQTEKELVLACTPHNGMSTNYVCNTWLSLINYNSDMVHDDDQFTITKVYGNVKYGNMVFDFSVKYRELLWSRPEKKKYTYAQLREILGEEFEVVG